MFHEHSSLSYRMSDILGASTDDDWVMIDIIDSLALLHGNDVYDEFFYVLSSKRFGAETAALHWKNIVSHISSIIRTHYHHQGFLPAVLHYMQHEAEIISNPRLLEADYITNIQRSSITDGLTGLFNQTFFKISLSKIINQARHHDMPPFAVVFFDLDHFKHYNDTSGHLAGDRVLKRVAEILLENLRECDISSRYGGEEFALILPQTTRVLAYNVAQRIRKAVEDEKFPGQENLPSGNLTISGGIAEYPLDADSAAELIETADAELYKAKIRRNSIYPCEENRRKSVRRPLRSVVKLSPGSRRRLRTGLSLDVSEFGMSMGCDTLLSVGSPVNVSFNRPFWKCDCLLNGIVRQARRLGDLNCLGIEFNCAFFGFDADASSSLDDHRHRNKMGNFGAHKKS